MARWNTVRQRDPRRTAWEAQIIRVYLRGLSTVKTAEVAGVSDATVRRIVTTAGVVRSRGPIPK